MTSTTLDAASPAAASGTFLLGGDLPVHRIGYGTMQLTGPGHWYHPADMDAAKAVLRRAVDLGVNHLDTADAYGPETVEHLIRKALHPYPDHLVIATKGGMTRQGPNRWAPVGRPEYLRQCVEMSLRRLAVDRIDLYYLHRVDPKVPLEDQVGELAALRAEGKIRHIGLSKVTTTQIEAARRVAPITAVQNKFNRHERDWAVLDHCTRMGTAFVPYAPLAAGRLAATPGAAVRELRWLLDLSPVILPIPGSTSIQHLQQNVHPVP
ncbi:aldo/keto reductase [Myceligenerans xiligouense]|uniref:Aryl-alcohol dehydrogenase-like predicted oxidoreductase n=1 Tax=Myceligenerans xiligouense TaxID=253184 RepID=A0A3N4YQ81_9MICO|nr:aldo/keto reductase [Myceligenerans xiligouense]RPF21494.1 aryl-alcohol dehydrogenase-like predicted oxidoreductase [Myceligenerans xiligouense]